ncbi:MULTISPECIES: hypothetical protein [Chryseobacterium]|nr:MULTISPECIES: hypothetical protein [Chryseobacterium]MCS4302136.1 hypothetical protein [Chryseobacterium sp. BIGb0232]ROS18082.1 hypothetical protein EDF65_2472 [Chryseobacterium nakagawai]
MIPKEDADNMEPLMAGGMLSNTIILITDIGSIKEYKFKIPELW